MRKSYLFAGIGLFAAAVACGGDDGGSHETSDLSTLCARVCVRQKAPACAGDVPALCMVTCTSDATSTPAACSAQYNAVLTCTSKAAFICDASGQPQPQGCDAEIGALNSCLPPSPGVDAGSDAAVVPLVDAGQPVSDAGLFTDAGAVGSDAGVSPLACAPAKGDEACAACSKGSCCAEFAACVTNLGCAQLGDCVSNCADQDNACIKTCEDASPDQAVDQFIALYNCSSDACFAECSE